MKAKSVWYSNTRVSRKLELDMVRITNRYKLRARLKSGPMKGNVVCALQEPEKLPKYRLIWSMVYVITIAQLITNHAASSRGSNARPKFNIRVSRLELGIPRKAKALGVRNPRSTWRNFPRKGGSQFRSVGLQLSSC